MKRNLIVTIFVILILAGCKKSDEIAFGDSVREMYDKNIPDLGLNTIYVFNEEGIYTVVVLENGMVQEIVKFCSDRKNCNIQGLTLVQNEEISQYLNMSFNDLKQKLGEVHADIGSGFYIPSYITEDGYLISFNIENEIVVKVMKWDLFDGTIVDDVSSF